MIVKKLCCFHYCLNKSMYTYISVGHFDMHRFVSFKPYLMLYNLCIMIIKSSISATIWTCSVNS